MPDQSDVRRLPDLAGVVLGGSVVYANDETFAAAHNLIAPGPAVHEPDTFSYRGKVYDSWETSRRRDDGNGWLAIRLAAPGVLHDVVIDTTRFVGNAPGWARLTDAETETELLPRPVAARHRAPAPYLLAGCRPARASRHLPGRRPVPRPLERCRRADQRSRSPSAG